MKDPIRFSRILPLLLFFAANGLFAQAGGLNGTIAGQAKDETGGGLPGVNVQTISQERGVTRSGVTDVAGHFFFAAVPIGHYRVVFALSGFQTVTMTDNLVETEKTTELSVTMRLAAQAAEVTVTGEVPIVDKTTTSVQTRLRQKEFEKMPVGRSYQALLGAAPGVVGQGNANVHGSLGSNNLFIFDGVDTTDPTTGTFGSNLNFEAIQEVNVITSGVSAEYGRAIGGVISVITKSGTNTFEGSAKYIAVNDKWDEQNKTKNQVTGASLARVKFDQVNPTYTFTLGGPIWKDYAWFFGAYEKQKTTSPQRQTVVVPENFQQSLDSPFYEVKLTGQVTPSHQLQGRIHASPTNGFVIDYWAVPSSQIPVVAAELSALTRQDQTARTRSITYSGVFGSHLSAEALYAKNDETITVFPFQVSSLDNGAPHFSEADGKFYNGATFDGFVKRPRQQATAAVSYYVDFGGNSHSFKAGFDWQGLESAAQFAYPNNQFFDDNSFNPTTRKADPLTRQDYDVPLPSVSKGNVYAGYVRDKFSLGKQLFFELGVRYERDDGKSDIGKETFTTSHFSPRVAASYDIRGDGKTLALATYGRFYQFILQGLSDSFAQIPQQGNYNNFTWDGTKYVLANRVETGGASIQPNTGLHDPYLDEVTLGFQQQIGNTIGLGVRGVYRKFGDLIDDIVTLNTSGSLSRQFVNYDAATRKYEGIEATFEKRFSDHWLANANYTYSRVTGNHYANSASSLGDFLNSTCRTTADSTVGTGGIIPCSEVNNGSRKDGLAAYDRPHNVKLGAAYSRLFGPVSASLGMGGNWISGVNYQKQRTVNVLIPGTSTNSGQTATYFYDDRGNERLPGAWTIDTSLELTFKIFSTLELGGKGEVFNVTNRQEQITVNNLVWCNNFTNPSAACVTARNTFGLATARGAFQAPRSYRLTALLRF